MLNKWSKIDNNVHNKRRRKNDNIYSAKPRLCQRSLEWKNEIKIQVSSLILERNRDLPRYLSRTYSEREAQRQNVQAKGEQ